MVIVASAKSLPKSKKKPVTSTKGVVPGNNKKAIENKNATANNANNKFTRPAPRPLTVATPTLVGGGRGKIKTTRNNTLPLPSPKSGLLTNGPRIHAQRKFAQGASTSFVGNSGLASVHANYKSPTVTPTKDGNKFPKKRVLTPISPPLKRPKTEDFLTFLCFRGTSALPTELEYFNYSQPLQVEEMQVQTKKHKETVVSVSTGVGSTSVTDNLQNAVPITTAAISMTNGCPSRGIANTNGIKIPSVTASTSATASANRTTKHSVTRAPTANGVLKRQTANFAATQKEITTDKVALGGEDTKKDNLSTATKKAASGTGKVVAKKAAVTPQISPSTSRINEQDAKFAMTALKLKYQEKRLASGRPAKSLITMLTKKVKERSMVLTRSRAKTAVGPLKTSPLQRKRKQTLTRPHVKPIPRNAPSPDIILGVAHSPVKPVESRRPSSSDSESSSESKKSSSSDSSSSSESEEEPEPTTRSLRSGKELVTKPKSDQQQQKSSSSTAKKKSSLPTRRMGTRASHRHTKSPLRELPMWSVNVKKKKILAKYKKNSAKAKANINNKNNKKPGDRKNSSPDKSSPGHVTRSSLRKSSGFSRGRPSRKTKETAAIYLGLLNKDFSSDDDESKVGSDEDDRASSLGDSSSSEAKYLEKHYNESLKRNSNQTKSTKRKEGKSVSSSSRLRSHQQQNTASSKSQSNTKSSKASTKSVDNNSSEKTSYQQKGKKKEEKPMPRVLRSQSSGSVDSNSRTDTSTAAERRRILMMTCGKNTAGAARKSAKVVSRGRRSRNYSSSSEDDDESDKSDGSSDLEDDDEREEDNVTQSDSQSEEEQKVEKASIKRDSTASPMSIPSSRGSRAKVKRVTELINESKGGRSPSSRRSLSSSPVDNRSKSESEDAKSIASETGMFFGKSEAGIQEEERMEMDEEEEGMEAELEEDEEDEEIENDVDEELEDVQGGEVDNEMDEEADNEVDDEDVENEVDEEEVENEVDEEEADNEADEEVGKEVDEDIENEVDEDIENEVDEDIENEVDEDIENEVDEEIENEVENEVDGEVENEVDEEAENEVDEEVENEIDEEEIENEVDEEEAENEVDDEVDNEMEDVEDENEREKFEEGEETEEDKDGMEDLEGDEDDDIIEDEDDITPSPVASLHGSVKESETEDPDDNIIPSPVASQTNSNTTSPISSSASEGESDDDEDDDDDTPEPPPKVSIAIQVDMDLEDEEEEKLRQEAKRNEQNKKESPLQVEQLVKQTAERTTSIELPLSEQQQAELREAQEEDDEIQEIGQVINNPSTIHNCNHARLPTAPSPPIVTEPPRLHRPPPQQPEHIPISIPLPPLTSRTSSLTYTSHHINLGGSSVPFVPYSTRPPTSEFFHPPPIHFGHAHLVNSVHLVGSSSTGHASVGMDFANDLASPLSTLSIPVSVPTLPSFPNPLLPPAPSICLGPGGTTMTATSLQTHIRTVATNLDIPLVRPVIGATDSSLSFSHLGMTPQSQLGSVPLLGAPSTSLLSRPMGGWAQATPTSSAAVAAAAAAAEARSHYSAFRLPTFQPTTTNGMALKDIMRPHMSSSLPVSILHPRTLSQHQLHQLHTRHHQHVPSSSVIHQNLHHHHHHHNRDSHHHSSSSASTAYMQNYNPESIIRTLPNVSIVPKFDRSSVKTQLPSQQPSACSSTSSSSSSRKSCSGKHEEPKKPGKKKSKPVTLPTPSSPLTVRKDSNPATYASSSAKLKSKSDPKTPKETPAVPSSPRNCERERASPKLHNKFDKLLIVKQEKPDEDETPPTNSTSKHAPLPCFNVNDNNGTSSPGPALLRLDQIKQEVISNSSSSVRKSHSPSVGHRKTPDRPSSSSSTSTNEKIVPLEENKKCSGKKSNSAKKLQEAPTYHPTEQEFEDPLKFFDKIQPEAEKYGMARIVPPRSFRPECNVNDDMRFTAYNHYIHKMYNRWGPTVQETEAIKEHLKRSDVDVSSVPVIGGLEIDFSTLYQIVQSLGGLKEVMENERWADVADGIHIPKGTHDRATKLDSVYVKYILPYDLLSAEERNNLKKSVQEKWERRQQKLQERTDESSEDETSDEDSMDELDDCVIKGKGTPLSSYYRVARNTVGMIFPNGKEPSIQDLEEEYWKIVREGKKHLCVYSGSIDCAGVGWGFPAPKPSAKHPWNLKVLANNAGSVLRSMGPVMGATVPTLHVSMLFTSYCWYRDPHGLPWVEYLHSGASKIWYSVAAGHEQTLRKALMKLMPLQCKNKKLWLPSDSAMVPPELLLENDVPLVRAVQNPGEFLVVFPKSYTSAICAGYLVSESVCFAPPLWLRSCMELFKDIRDSKEPPVFPIEKLLLSIVRDNRVTTSVIKMTAPLAEKVILEELALRKKLITMGVGQGGKPNKNGSAKGVAKKKKSPSEEEVEQCYFCNYILHMSLVRNERTDFVTCLPHAIQHLSRHKAQIKKCSLLCEETQDELESLLQTAKRRANT